MIKSLHDIDPVSMTDAVNFLFENLEEDERHYIEMNGAEGLHFSAGMAIRNAWIHPEGSLLKEHFLANFDLGHPDDMSGMILKALSCKVQKKAYDIKADVEAYHTFWAEQGLSPLTGEPL